MSVRRNQRRPDGGIVTQRHVQGWGLSEVIRYPPGHVPVAPAPRPSPVEIIILPPDRPAKPSRIRPSIRALIAHAEDNERGRVRPERSESEASVSFLNENPKGTSMALTVPSNERGPVGPERSESEALVSSSSRPRSSRAQVTYDRVETECYALAVERWGKGSAVSLDTDGGGFVARAWKPSGELGLAGDGGQRTKLAALRKLKKRLTDLTATSPPGLAKDDR